MTEYVPDRWVLVEISNDGSKVVKVFGGWYGSYLYGSSWRLNSGITGIEAGVEDVGFVFHGSSGSRYLGRKTSYGLTAHMAAVLDTWKSVLSDDVRMLSEDEALAFCATFHEKTQN